MGANIYQPENFQTPALSLDFFHGGITPVKTEPLVLRAITDLIASQVLTQQIVTQLATLQMKGRSGQSYITQGQRADEGGAYDDGAETLHLLTQRVQELERRLEETSTKKSAAAASR